jgi:FkbM family methyltransferase
VSVQIVQTKLGPVLARRNDPYIGASLCYYGEYSAGEAKWFAEVLRPGDVAIDVGANIGALTIPMSHLVGAKGLVYAFEPQRLPFQMLCGSIALQDRRNVMAICAPVAEKSGRKIVIPDLDIDAHANVGGLSLLEPHKEGIVQSSVALDDIHIPACRLLKADVEGMEMAVLEGARELVKKHRPVLHLEANHEPEAYALRDWLEPLGYRCFMQFIPLYNPNNFKAHRPNIWKINNQSINLVALPEWWDSPVPKRLRPITDEGRATLFCEKGGA